MDRFLWGGWVVGTPECFFIFVLALVPCLILFYFGLRGLSFVVASPVLVCTVPTGRPYRLTVFSLTALCRPCLFLVCLAFTPCSVLVHANKNHVLHIYALLIHFVA